MAPEPVQWADRGGTVHELRPASDLTSAERSQLDLLRRQVGYAFSVLDAGFHAPAVKQASPNMTRMMFRVLMPNVAEEEIATFDTTKGHDLLTRWWALADATG